MNIHEQREEIRSLMLELRRSGFQIVQGQTSDSTFWYGNDEELFITKLKSGNGTAKLVVAPVRNGGLKRNRLTLVLAFDNDPGELVTDYPDNSRLAEAVTAYEEKWEVA